jgi:DNA-binding NtrC family response regulator
VVALNGGRHAVLVQLDKPSSGVLTTCLETLGVRCHVSVRAEERERGDLDLAFLDGRAHPQLIRTWIERATSVVLVYEADDDAIFDFEGVDWLSKPLRPSQVRQVVTAALDRAHLRRALDQARERLAHDLPAQRIIARSKTMRRALEQLARAPAAIDRPVLVCGEPGSGRGLLARTAADEAGHGVVELVPGDVATDRGLDLLRDELAASSRESLLLRDVDRFARDAQRMVTAALGRPRRKIIVTAHDPAPFDDAVERTRIAVPPLRDRVDDLLPLARHFLEHYAAGARLSADAEAVLIDYAWPRNVTELRNTIERVSFGGAPEIAVSDLPAHLFGPRRLGAYVGGDFTFADIEQAHLVAVTNRIGTRHEAARVLGIDDSTLWRMRKRHQMP